ncbi:helix-turn-helix domain-containing protein [Pseudodesulfovibrio nedwellii]|uniref:helix-turn-helix domain-containing protein n=1 Tax=Pseudodesulfovibrio nedwellii TaxID=2973072 RepID=UPI002492B431|nr:AraC family transcriptional regulator [Pseudodesulfovibrio nedwellii]
MKIKIFTTGAFLLFSNADQVSSSSCSSTSVASSTLVRNFPTLNIEDKKAWFGRLWQEEQLSEGLFVSVFDASLSHDFSLEFGKDNALIDFGFFLEGTFVNTVNSLARGPVEFENRAGEYGVGYVSEMNGSFHLPARRKTRVMHLHVLPSTLGEMLGWDLERVSPCLLKVLENKRNSAFVHHRRQTALVQAVANELFYSIKKRSDIKMYIEGKVLELLALALTDSPGMSAVPSVCPRLRDVLHAVREELEKNYASPPTLSEISAQYHMPIATVQAGFKTLFGMSVFAFVKEYRLQRAKLFFAEGNMNVSQVAWDIGYTNLSHFSAAYKKRFGVLPKAYLKSLREHLHTF